MYAFIYAACFFFLFFWGRGGVLLEHEHYTLPEGTEEACVSQTAHELCICKHHTYGTQSST
jgi:hypothetical protein